MKLPVLTFKLFVIICLTFYSTSNPLDTKSERFLQATTNPTNTTNTDTPFGKMVDELKLSISPQGKPVLQKLLDSEFILADSDKNGKVNETELNDRLKAFIIRYKIPSNIDTQPMFTKVLESIQKDNDPNYTKEEFDAGITTGISFLVSYLIGLTDTPYEKLINADGYKNEILTSLNQEKNTSTNNFQKLWAQVSQGYSSINVAAAIEFIGGLCFKMGYPESNAESIKAVVTKQSKNNSLVRNDFETAAREALQNTYDYIDKTQVPAINTEIAAYIANSKKDVVSFLFKLLLFRP